MEPGVDAAVPPRLRRLHQVAVGVPAVKRMLAVGEVDFSLQRSRVPFVGMADA